MGGKARPKQPYKIKPRKTVKGILNECVRLFKSGAWTQGDYIKFYPRDGGSLDASGQCYCALGALMQCNLNIDSAEYKAARAAVRDQLPMGAIVGWNDDLDRTPEEVIEVFEKAAASV